MKKLLLILLIICNYKVYALTDIKIDNEDLNPKFDIETRIYNYYTNKSNIIINVKPTLNELLTYDREVSIDDYKEVTINSSIYGDYKINIFKDYENNKSKEVYLTNLEIEGYEINFDKDKYEYEITIDNENELNISYELSNEGYVKVTGNGNFNKSDNLITINVGNSTYKIHVYKTIKTVKMVNNEEIKEMGTTKKEIVKLVIITISSIIIFVFYYIVFINKTILNI